MIGRGKMNLIWNTAAAVIVSLGGGGTIVWFLVKWYSGILADKLSKQYAHRLSAELEKYKAELDKRKYVSNKRFEVELAIYQELVKAVIDMTETTYLLFPPFDYLPPDPQEEQKVWIGRYKKAIRKYNQASELIFKNAPFMNKTIHKKCLDLRNNCREQILYAKTFRIDVDSDNNRKSMPEKYEACWTMSEDVIVKKRDAFINILRQYLKSLEKMID